MQSSALLFMRLYAAFFLVILGSGPDACGWLSFQTKTIMLYLFESREMLGVISKLR